ncbi:hypothetical protein D9619_008750 [Psilocybe cf. subviscida]|uniref:C2H2-type domain-containing protein n=1 Tax=Psilocybe cf. subviscida TaxID=2480587 RepID=A0A8H5B9Y9_9AGAR|nr:hypothetical protein D9619_008750 [Psilocybe cf. subviscida]
MPKGVRKAKPAPPAPLPSPPAALPDAISPPSPSNSDSSGDDTGSNASDIHAEGSYDVSASRPGSPIHGAEGIETDDVVTCQWEDCGIVFDHLPTLIGHIHNEHIGVHKSNYTCEWSSCLRRGLPQTSRFALISHIRSHTGEKPFICPLPECDKSFTRSDALAKHMRLQHNISPPAPGRGGNRKRKRDDLTQGTSTPVASAVVSPPVTGSMSNSVGFISFKVEPQTPSEFVDDPDAHDYFSGTKIKANGRRRQPHRQSHLHSQHSPGPEDHMDFGADDGSEPVTVNNLPPRLRAQLDESTGLVMGRSPAKIMYLLMKAKHRYAVEQRNYLLEELQNMNDELQKQTLEKDAALDDLLQRMLGTHAGILIPHPNDNAVVDVPV